jgi:H+/gluconate symporter-like permease
VTILLPVKIGGSPPYSCACARARSTTAQHSSQHPEAYPNPNPNPNPKTSRLVDHWVSANGIFVTVFGFYVCIYSYMHIYMAYMVEAKSAKNKKYYRSCKTAITKKIEEIHMAHIYIYMLTCMFTAMLTAIFVYCNICASFYGNVHEYNIFFQFGPESWQVL